jgi:hypothetical protein
MQLILWLVWVLRDRLVSFFLYSFVRSFVCLFVCLFCFVCLFVGRSVSQLGWLLWSVDLLLGWSIHLFIFQICPATKEQLQSYNNALENVFFSFIIESTSLLGL